MEPSRSQPVDFALARPAPDRQAVASWFAPSNSSPEFQTYPTPGYAGGPVASSQPGEWATPSSSQPSTQNAEPFDEFANSAGQEPVAPPSSEPSSIEPVRSGRTPRALQVHDSYLIAETDEGMIVIDQHALHERILYEELKARLDRGGVEGQRLLVPEPIDLSGSEAAKVLQYRDLLARLGIGVEPFGGDTVLVTSTPVMLAHVPPDRLLRDLAEHIHGKPLPPTPDVMLEDVLNMVACKAAVKAGQRLSAEEVAALLERRHLAANTHHCPHGRPTALTFTKAELERQFGRI